MMNLFLGVKQFSPVLVRVDHIDRPDAVLLESEFVTHPEALQDSEPERLNRLPLRWQCDGQVDKVAISLGIELNRVGHLMWLKNWPNNNESVDL